MPCHAIPCSRQHLAFESRVSTLPWWRSRCYEARPPGAKYGQDCPHFACLPVEPYASMYNPADIPPWDNFGDTFEGKPPGHRRKLLEWNLQDKDWGWWSQVVARYYAVISQIDRCVGDVLAAIDDAGIADNTIVFYSTDNGPHMNTWPDAAMTPVVRRLE